MKKYLLLILAFLFVFTSVLTACKVSDDETSGVLVVSDEPSKDISETESKTESENESSDAEIPSESPSEEPSDSSTEDVESEEPSEEPSDEPETSKKPDTSKEPDTSKDVSETPDDEPKTLTEDDILKTKKVLYYDGDHYTHMRTELLPHGTKEVFSSVSGESIKEYIKNETVASNTYFLIGIEWMKNTVLEQSASQRDADNRRVLKEVGMVLSNDHPLLTSLMPAIETPATEDQTRNAYIKRWKTVLPEFDASIYTTPQVCQLPNFNYIGYITADGLKKLNDYKDYAIFVTWLNAPDNYKVWENSIY